jgi:hypothetical protein
LKKKSSIKEEQNRGRITVFGIFLEEFARLAAYFLSRIPPNAYLEYFGYRDRALGSPQMML